jgi:hypothetical protein
MTRPAGKRGELNQRVAGVELASPQNSDRLGARQGSTTSHPEFQPLN